MENLPEHVKREPAQIRGTIMVPGNLSVVVLRDDLGLTDDVDLE